MFASRLIVAGVCMESDRSVPVIAIGKEARIHFTFGYCVEAFTQTWHALAGGTFD